MLEMLCLGIYACECIICIFLEFVNLDFLGFLSCGGFVFGVLQGLKMPLYKRKPFALVEKPKDLKPNDLVFQVRFTKEIFKDYR